MSPADRPASPDLPSVAPAPAAPAPSRAPRTLAFAALLLGGAALGLSPIFVRLADVGPAASAFWRLALALPFLWLWLLVRERARPRAAAGLLAAAVLAGFFFAADLAVWHWSIVYTTVANATLLANFAPIFVTLGGWWLFGQRASGAFLAAMIVALAGTTLLVGPSFGLGGTRLAGDALGLLTAVFYAGYMLSIKRARAGVSTALLMAASTTVSVLALWPVAALAPQPMLPASAAGWAVLLGLALVSQVLGQSLIAYAFAHLSAAFSSLAVLTQPVVATALAWLLFGEVLAWAQLLGGALVLTGILMARRTG
jgi:drug/metabolite transporter (DMT)-like permease